MYNYDGVIHMLRRAYRTLVREKFFNRMLLTYTAIIILILAALAAVTMQNQRAAVKNEAANSNSQVSAGVVNYIQKEYGAIMIGFQQLYEKQQEYAGIFDLLEDSNSSLSPDYYHRTQIVNDYLYGLYLSDNDIESVQILKIRDNTSFLYSKPNGYKISKEDRSASLLKGNFASGFYGMKYLTRSQINPDGSGDGNEYFLAAAIKSRDMSVTIGILLIGFDTASLQSVIQNNTQFQSHVQIFTDAGSVLFNSLPGTAPEMSAQDILAYRQNLFPDNAGGVTEVSQQGNMGLITYSHVDPGQINGKLRQIWRGVFSIFIACLVAAVALSYFCVSLFSKRVKRVNKAIQQVREGDLSSRILVGNSFDEIGQISVNFNEMCGRLEEYINKVYIAELERRNIEMQKIEYEILVKADLEKASQVLRENLLIRWVSGCVSLHELEEKSPIMGISVQGEGWAVGIIRPPADGDFFEDSGEDSDADSAGYGSSICVKKGCEDILAKNGGGAAFTDLNNDIVIVFANVSEESYKTVLPSVLKECANGVTDESLCGMAASLGSRVTDCISVRLSYEQAKKSIGRAENNDLNTEAVCQPGQLAAREIDRTEPTNPFIQNLLCYVERHYAEALTLKTMAADFKVTPSYLGKLIKNEIGEAFSAYLNKLRIEKAKEMLQTTSLSAGEIGQRVGYQNVDYFYKIFKKITGEYPTRYKRSCLGDESAYMLIDAEMLQRRAEILSNTGCEQNISI